MRSVTRSDPSPWIRMSTWYWMTRSPDWDIAARGAAMRIATDIHSAQARNHRRGVRRISTVYTIEPAQTRNGRRRRLGQSPRMADTARSGVRSTPLGATAVLTAVTAWSLINVIVKIVHVPAITFAFYRLWFGSAVMLLT